MRAVEPVQRPKAHLLPPLKLYREDLDKIVGIFQKHCKTVMIDDEEYRYSSVDDMKNSAKRELKLFHVSGFLPHGEVWIKGANDPSVQKSMIWVIETTDQGNLLFLTVKDFLLSRKWAVKIVLVRTLFVLAGALFLAIVLFKHWLTTHLPYGEFSYSLLGVCAFVLFVVAVYVDAQKLSSISLQSRGATEPFLKRNANSILMLLIGSVLTVLTGILTLWIKSHFFN